MGSYRYKISLRLQHPTADPAEFTRVLGLVPSHSHKSGEPRLSYKGEPMSGCNKETLWVTEVAKGRWPDVDLSAAIEAAVGRIAGHKALFERIRTEGGHAEFFIGWFVGDQNGDCFDCDLLGRLAELKIDLSFDVYAEPSGDGPD